MERLRCLSLKRSKKWEVALEEGICCGLTSRHGSPPGFAPATALAAPISAPAPLAYFAASHLGCGQLLAELLQRHGRGDEDHGLMAGLMYDGHHCDLRAKGLRAKIHLPLSSGVRLPGAGG
jgi:hypothetical protein